MRVSLECCDDIMIQIYIFDEHVTFLSRRGIAGILPVGGDREPERALARPAHPHWTRSPERGGGFHWSHRGARNDSRPCLIVESKRSATRRPPGSGGSQDRAASVDSEYSSIISPPFAEQAYSLSLIISLSIPRSLCMFTRI